MYAGVLEHLGYINSDKVVQLKGRVACEVNTCEELLLTEIVFENVLEGLDAFEIAGLLSALICQEKSEESPSTTLPPALREACLKVMDIARGLGQVQVRGKERVVGELCVPRAVSPSFRLAHFARYCLHLLPSRRPTRGCSLTTSVLRVLTLCPSTERPRPPDRRGELRQAEPQHDAGGGGA